MNIPIPVELHWYGIEVHPLACVVVVLIVKGLTSALGEDKA